MNEMMLKLTELLKQEDFLAKFNAVENLGEMRALLQNNDIDIAEEDLLKALEIAVEKKESGELTESEMEDVSGGFAGFVVFGTICGIAAGVSMYNLRKVINTWNGTCN